MPDDDPIKPTETQPAPNISTEHQPEGGARFPSDTLDREPERGPAGQPHPHDKPAG
jgi:hypothetical protein